MAEASLLEAFPSPPTHIPNPPPSLPPSFPLPPVPGPSPISDNFFRRSIASHRDSIESSFLSPPEHLTRISVSPFPLSDIDDDDDDAAPANESISDIQLPLTEDEEEDSVHTADLMDPMTLHLQIRAARSRSESHRQVLCARSKSPSRAPRSARVDSIPPLPDTDPRPGSPDIATILSKTPRPRKQRSIVFSEMSSTSYPLPRRVSDGDIALEAKNGVYSDCSVSFPSELADDAAFDNLERTLEGDSDSDSSLDIHTPLPRLMVRDGLLSPRSKLLPLSERTSLDFRGSVLSTASNTSTRSKSGIMKDERDTPMRRHRHRDGKLLRGGIGLTTGLGWSDSEDEDAPSPLTRRLSLLNLSRRSSASSIRSAYSHPLSRSISTSRVPEEPEGNDAFEGQARQRSNTLSTNSTKLSHPPTSWQSRPPTSSHLSSSSVESKDSLRLSLSDQPDHIRRSASESENGFHETLNTPSTASSLSIPMPGTPSDESALRKPAADKNKSLPPLPAPPLRKIPSNLSIRTGSRPRTISSTSSISSQHSPPRIPLPPVPTSTSGSVTPRPLKLRDIHTRQARSHPQSPIYRGGGVDRPAVPVPSVTYSTSVPRPLTTSTSNSALTNSTRSLPRLASRLPSKSPTATTSSAGASPLPSPTAVSPSDTQPKPRPRVGSGMVYRTSSYSGIDAIAAGGTKLRMPKSLTLSSTHGQSPRSISTSLPPRPGMLRTPMPRS